MSTISVPILPDAQRLAESRHKEEQQRAARAIDRVCEHWGCTHIELSLALGVWAPDRGKGGRSLVSRWRAGERACDGYHLAVLELLADGELVLRHTGADGRRTLYAVAQS